MTFAIQPWRPPATPGYGRQTFGWSGGTAAAPRPMGGTIGGVTNPWQAKFEQTFSDASAHPYGADWKQGVAQAMALGNRNYEGDLRRFVAEDVGKQITAADNQLGSMDMRELALKGDVQTDRAKLRTDADKRAIIDAQGLKTNALETMRAMLGSATGAELDRVAQMIAAASAGGGNYNQFAALLLPLLEKLGYGGQGGGNAPTYLSK